MNFQFPNLSGLFIIQCSTFPIFCQSVKLTVHSCNRRILTVLFLLNPPQNGGKHFYFFCQSFILPESCLEKHQGACGAF